MKSRYLIIALLAALLFAGCFKKVTRQTQAVIKLMHQDVSGEQTMASTLDSIQVFVFNTKSEDWTINSWEDAIQAKITNITDGSTNSVPDAIGEPYLREGSENSYMAVELTQTPSMIVVVDSELKMYAYAFKRLEAQNLPQTYLSLIFHKWKTEDYVEGVEKNCLWHIFVNHSGDEPPVQETSIR